jgi:hypothetical protein
MDRNVKTFAGRCGPAGRSYFPEFEKGLKCAYVKTIHAILAKKKKIMLKRGFFLDYHAKAG